MQAMTFSVMLENVVFKKTVDAQNPHKETESGCHWMPASSLFIHRFSLRCPAPLSPLWRG